jgi:hypothetical protein
MSKTIVSGGGTGIKEWYGVLPDEAKEALRTGEYWSDEPESSDGGDSIAVWCESCGRYHQFYVETGLEVEDKTLYVTLWHVDTDGDWSQMDRCPADGPGFAEWERRNLGYEALQATWEGYYREVARTGLDELRIFSVGEQTRKATYKVFLRGAIYGVVLGYVRERAGHGPALRPGLRSFPKKVSDYFMLRNMSGTPAGPFVIDDPGIKTLDDVRRLAGDTIKWTSRTRYPLVEANGLITLDVPLAEARRAAGVKRAAKRALADLTISLR